VKPLLMFSIMNIKAFEKMSDKINPISKEANGKKASKGSAGCNEGS